jgi:hypothetical protein
MLANSDQGQATPSMDSFTDGIKKTVMNFAAIFLALALLGALWSTALARLSDRTTAVTLLTKAGTDLINPLLTANGSGLAQDFYQQLQAQARAHPAQVMAIPFAKVHIKGSAIAGKSFADGTRVIYAAIATAYYNGGPSGAFALPPQLQSLVGSYTPFVQQAQQINSPLPGVPLPQLPAFASGLWSATGITPTSLTAAGHDQAVSRSYILWGISVALALLLVLLSTGWDRLWRVAWPLFHSSWHIALLGVIGTILVHRDIAHTGPYQGVMDLIGGTFMPVFYVAALAGIAGIVIALVGRRITAQAAAQASATPARAPAMTYAAANTPPVAHVAETQPMPPAGGYPANPPQENAPAPNYAPRLDEPPAPSQPSY